MLLQVKDLSIRLNNRALVSDVNFSLAHNQCLGILGESGSGKSLTSFAINGLLAEQFSVSGSVLFKNENLLALSPQKRRAIRGSSIAMIMQSPMSAFNPLFSIGNQIQETLCQHLNCRPQEALEIMAAIFERVKLNNPRQLFSKYPHELSGGMLQRIMISFAIALKPELLIADEPTTAIDYISQREVIKELQSIRELCRTSIIFISHDLSLISHIADNVLVMNQGRVVEQGESRQIFTQPQNAHTRYLIDTRMKLIKRFKQMMSNNNAD